MQVLTISLSFHLLAAQRLYYVNTPMLCTMISMAVKIHKF